MQLPLFIPWFKAEPVYIPLPFDIPVLPNGIPIQPFGVLVAIGVLLGIRMSEEFAKRNDLRAEAAYDFTMYAIVPGFIGGYVLNVVFYDPALFLRAFTEPRLLLQWHGLSSFGGFFGTFIGALIWYRRYRLNILLIGDATAFGFPFGWFFGRMGCFVVHDHPGRQTDFFLAVDNYVTGEPPYVPRHDLGLYEVIWSAAMMVLFVYLWRTPKRIPGLYFALLCVLYPPIRFCLDFLRADAEEGGDVRYFGLTPGHYSSLFFLGLGLYIMRWLLTTPPQRLPAELAEPEAGTATVATTGEPAPSTAPKAKAQKKNRR